jgi:hypothetical protein
LLKVLFPLSQLISFEKIHPFGWFWSVLPKSPFRGISRDGHSLTFNLQNSTAGLLTFVLLFSIRQSGKFNCLKIIQMKKSLTFTSLSIIFLLCLHTNGQAQTNIVKKGEKYDTIIVKKGAKPAKKTAPKPVAQQAVVKEIVLPTPEFVNQPYYYDKDSNRLIRLENANALMVTKKKTLGLKGAKQFLSMADPSSKARFTSKTNIDFIIKTSGDVIDLTSYIKLYKFIPADEKREVTINSKEGMLNDKEEGKGKLVNFSVKTITKENYMILLPEQLEAGEYGFVWVKNMELKEFTVFAFGIDWKSSD